MNAREKHILVAALVVGVVVAGCDGNRAPSDPTISGPSGGAPGAALAFTVKATDPEGDQVAHKVDWDDQSSEEWGDYRESGEPVTVTHTFADTGVYTVKAKARDAEGAESGWSAGLKVTVSSSAPNPPSRPSGPTACSTGVAYAYSATVTHPVGDSIQVQFDWGGSYGAWGAPIASGATYTEAHSFDSAGTFTVAARAKDAADEVSDWSEPLVVSVVARAGDPPTNLRLEPETELTVRLRWDPPLGNTERYKIYFKDVQTGDFSHVGTAAGLSYVHDPDGATGWYIVSAVFASGEEFSTDTVSTVPVHTGELVVGELNAAGNAGYGWDRATGIGETFPMSQVASIGLVDFYVTDRVGGHQGSNPLYIASPHLVGNDGGNNGWVPNGDWRETGCSGPLANEHDPLPAPGLYSSFTMVSGYPCLVGCRTADECYALVKVTARDTAQSTATVETWFQRVPELRLIKH